MRAATSRPSVDPSLERCLNGPVRRPPGLFVAASLGLCWPAAALTPPPVVAVFELRDGQGRLSAEERSQITRYFRVKLTERASFPVVPEAELKRAIADQQAESYKECYDEACQIEIGREVAAQKSLALELVSVGARCILTATLFDLAKATSERAASVDSACDASALAQAVSALADQLGPSPGYAPRLEPQTAAAPAETPGAERVRVRVQTTDEGRQFEVSLFDADGRERRCSPALRVADVCHLGSGRIGQAQVTVRVPELGIAQATLPFDETHTQAVVEVGVGRSWWAYGAWWMGGSMGVGGLMCLGLGAGAGSSTDASRLDKQSFLLVTGTVLSVVGAAVFATGFFLPRPIDIDEHLLETPGT